MTSFFGPYSRRYNLNCSLGDGSQLSSLSFTGEQTAGAYAVVEAFVPPGGGPPAHVHRREDEAFLVVEGEFEFNLGGKRVRLNAGGFIFGPRGVPHAFKSVGPTAGRMIGTRLPGREDAPIPPTPEHMDRVAQLAASYGVEIVPG
jgi:mannose-6-phosphate isomerase-like protein (cupin superfamily)